MAEMTIRLRINPETGMKDIHIALRSDADALPHEHEQDHKKLVESLLGMPLTDDMGEIVVERVQKDAQKVGQVQTEPGHSGREAVKNKG